MDDTWCFWILYSEFEAKLGSPELNSEAADVQQLGAVIAAIVPFPLPEALTSCLTTVLPE